MCTAAAMGNRGQLTWSHWFRCTSSFDLSLAPEAPGIFAVGREEPGQQVSIVKIEEADNLFQALNQLFDPKCPLREEIRIGHCLLRYASVTDAGARHAAVLALQAWLTTGMKSQIADEFLGRGPEAHPFRGKSD